MVRGAGAGGAGGAGGGPWGREGGRPTSSRLHAPTTTGKTQPAEGSVQQVVDIMKAIPLSAAGGAHLGGARRRAGAAAGPFQATWLPDCVVTAAVAALLVLPLVSLPETPQDAGINRSALGAAAASSEPNNVMITSERLVAKPLVDEKGSWLGEHAPKTR